MHLRVANQVPTQFACFSKEWDTIRKQLPTFRANFTHSTLRSTRFDNRLRPTGTLDRFSLEFRDILSLSIETKYSKKNKQTLASFWSELRTIPCEYGEAVYVIEALLYKHNLHAVYLDTYTQLEYSNHEDLLPCFSRGKPLSSFFKGKPKLFRDDLDHIELLMKQFGIKGVFVL